MSNMSNAVSVPTDTPKRLVIYRLKLNMHQYLTNAASSLVVKRRSRSERFLARLCKSYRSRRTSILATNGRRRRERRREKSRSLRVVGQKCTDSESSRVHSHNAPMLGRFQRLNESLQHINYRLSFATVASALVSFEYPMPAGFVPFLAIQRHFR